MSQVQGDAARALTIPALISRGGQPNPTAHALLGLGGEVLRYEDILSEIHAGAMRVRELGVLPGARIALHVANGLMLARSLLAAVSFGEAAPLNPGIGERDLAFYLEDLSPDLLIVDEHSPAHVQETAIRLGVRTMDLGDLLPHPREASVAEYEAVRSPDDIALILHTSGTTARPKQVPLTHANLCHSAAHVAETYRLEATDRCLGLMPLFHIHGIVATVLATLLTGGSIVCTPKLDPDRILSWFVDYAPTWYTGVPTMHQAILRAVAAAGGATHRLRFIRSCSSALPPIVMERLEAAFGVPVVEAYGMTEAAHQMSSNLLPPGTRKAGTVGFATGPEICILDAGGCPVPSGKRGEVCVRGPNVMGGYLDNPDANATSFTDGWFRTGDEGYFDEDGALVLSSRIKEIVNRGGEKIAPREVDEALLEHPAVRQAVAFAVPHASLGEDLAAAVVLRDPSAQLTEGALRRFLFERLAPEKVPSQILFVEAIPKGPTGKLKRIGLHEPLARQLHPAYSPPETPFEIAVAEIWGEVLDAVDTPIGRFDNFFALGGDSLRVARVLVRVRDRFGAEVPVERLFETPTVAGLAETLLGLLMENDRDL